MRHYSMCGFTVLNMSLRSQEVFPLLSLLLPHSSQPPLELLLVVHNFCLHGRNSSSNKLLPKRWPGTALDMGCGQAGGLAAETCLLHCRCHGWVSARLWEVAAWTARGCCEEACGIESWAWQSKWTSLSVIVSKMKTTEEGSVVKSGLGRKQCEHLHEN